MIYCSSPDLDEFQMRKLFFPTAALIALTTTAINAADLPPQSLLERTVREGRAMSRVGELEVLTMATGIAENPLVAPIRRARINVHALTLVRSQRTNRSLTNRLDRILNARFHLK
jgi:hypothetical protein